MNKQTIKTLALSLIVAGISSIVFAHCQIPCGIYGDETRFTLMREHVATIEKSMKQIESLGKEKQPDYNQIVRWVTNKDDHADELAEIVTYYFMAQRVKPASEDNKEEYDKYIRKITMLHQILVLSMKTKQTINLDNCSQLTTLIDKFEKLYNG